jgi:hypothetical protein
MKIVSFGDSFIYGSELEDNHNGSQAWPGLIAADLGYNYETFAIPGCGNESIAMQILDYFAVNSAENTLAVVNWTWTQRWDFYIKDHETWITLGPTCVPEKLADLVDRVQGQRLVEFYQDYANSSLLWNKFRTLQTVANVQQYLKQKGVNAIQTFTDRHMFDTQWHAPNYVLELQDIVKPAMSDWDGLTFLEWTDKKGFYKTHTWHPLEDAHQAAAEFWADTYKKAI